MSRRLLVGNLIVLALWASALAWSQPVDTELGIDETTLLGAPKGKPLEGAALQAATLELGSKMRCPVCQGLSIAASPTPSAVTMLGQVRDLFAQGYTHEQILDYFESSYGEFIRLSPRADGLNLLVWLAPIAVLLIGGGILWRRARSRTESNSGSTEDADLDDYLARVRVDTRPDGGSSS